MPGLRLPLFLLYGLLVSCMSASADTLFVSAVMDGDTYRLSSGAKIRLLGIDCPEVNDSRKLSRQVKELGLSVSELKKYGEQAKIFSENEVNQKKVRIEYGERRQDKFGRDLVYLFVDDTIFVNRRLVAEGYARVYTQIPFQYREEFLRLEQQARENNKGLWQNKAWLGRRETVRSSLWNIQPPRRFTAQKNSSIFHQPECRFIHSLSKKQLIYFENLGTAEESGRHACPQCLPEKTHSTLRSNPEQ